MSFRQKDRESLNAAWTRFKKMLRVCTVHGLSVDQQVETFYYGVDSSVRSMHDAAANGSLYRNTPTAALEIISNMAESNVANKSAPVKQVNQVQGSTEAVGGPSSGIPFMPDAFFDGMPVFEGDSAENSVEPQCFNLPQQPAQQRPPQQTVRPPQGAGPSMPPGFNTSENNSNLEDMLAKYIAGNEMRWQNHDATMQRVETQLGQLANQLSSRAPGSLPSDTVKNPKEVNAIFVQQAMKVKTEEKEVKVQHTPKQVILSPRKGKKGKEDDLNSNVDISSFPFPQRARQLNFDHQFKKFLEIFKKLHVNIPFADALAQIPSYAKFLKEILANKRKLTNLGTVNLNEECSAVLLNKLPPKLQDPRSFSIPCAIGSMSFDKALCDLGASINLMPYSLAKKLGIGVMEPTTMSLKLADRSIKHPKGIVENVLLKVDEFIFPVDFVVLDMDDDRETPLILGRPFLATSRALIDFQNGELILRLNEKQVVFNMFKSDSSYPKVNDFCLNDDARGTCTKELTAISQNPKFSVEEPPGLEYKSLPSYLKYVTLEDSSIPVIVSSYLAGREESKLARLLRDYIRTMGWSIDDIKGLGPIVIVDDSIGRNRGDEGYRSTTSNDPP
ncbi:uncharacterized protein [Henckelia pumila]|uniref:uncharacterized protein n=1 Tax=Henckelia pumila TaxID=405737 RepID=UPI003C6E3A05